MKKLTLFLLGVLCANFLWASSPYRLFPYGKVIPKGWILTQMENDLNEGLTGNYDKINNTVNCNLFVNKDRYSDIRYERVGDSGTLRCWWSGEHEGYWKESMIRLAYLTGNKAAMQRANKWVNEILASTDNSGYIGIYADDKPGASRFDHNADNGEFWTQGLMNSALLSYYEFTGRKDVLDAVEKSVALTMKAYADKPAFERSKGGGVSHAVGYFEMLEELYRLTGKSDYKDFVLKMREDMNNSILRDDDLRKDRLLDADRKFMMHGAHIGEGFFIPQFVAELSTDVSDKQAADAALVKLRYHLTPSGAMTCDEMIRAMEGNADNYYEYCSTVELINSLDRVMAMRNDLTIGDVIERAAFNALQGARLADLSGLSYLTCDNRKAMSRKEHGGRETYDVCHTAAACCSLNGGRLMPFYLRGMWMRSEDNKEIVAALYGPCVLNTTIDGTDLTIEEKTGYPFEDRVVLNLSLSGSKKFALVLRKPFGVKDMDVKGVPSSEIKDMGDRLVIDRVWKSSDKVELRFKFDAEYVAQKESPSLPEGGCYLRRGPIVYALPFAYTSKEVRKHLESGFIQQLMKVKDTTGWDYKFDRTQEFVFSPVRKADLDKPFFQPVIELKGKMIDPEGRQVPVGLVPIGNTVMRRVVFPVK